MLTKKTAWRIQYELGGFHPSNTLVAVARDSARREWTCYCIEEGGRLFHFNPVTRDGDGSALSELLEQAAGESGGIDPAALLATDEPTEGEQIAESTRRETTRTTAADVMYSTFRILSPEQAARARDYSQARSHSLGEEVDQAIAWFGAMASVMGQVEKVGKMMGIEDSLYRTRSEDGPDPFGIKKAYLNAVAALLRDGWIDRAASRWSAQVRAKLAEREEARRDNYAIRVQGEED